ncbi:hypothetical protein [Terrimonas pollutisoli]|uniref:hypothetical protein n=1 Tax=Terrimonas pollutisoli TaxID=3034147 RepID=UPI0023EDBE70|nr:hypothetical protein [Terrimonas sp. H1YJ31]
MSKYPKTLTYYMWGWQVHFRISCKTNAESLFNHFDRGLKPHVFMVGIANKSDKNPVLCFEPEDQDVFAGDFARLSEVVNNILDTDPDKDMLYSGPGMQEVMDVRRRREAVRKGVEIILSESVENKSGYWYHCSDAAQIGGYHVYVVLGLVKEVYDSYTFLMKTLLDDRRLRIYQSVLETAVEAYLKEKWKNLNMPEAGKNLSMDSRPTEDLLREAARNFMYTVSSKGKEFMGLHGLFDICDKISTYSYEGSQNTGHLIIADKSDKEIEMVFELKESFEINDLRKTRKLLQLSNEQLGVICDSYNIFGLGRVHTEYAKSSESIFDIHFIATHCWRVKHHDNVVLEMRYGLPEFTTEVIPRNKFGSDIKRIFVNTSNDQIENLYKLAIAATKQANGSMLVVVNDAAQEAERLNIQCLPVKPVSLSEDSVMQLTSIDGAVLLNTDGTAFAYGVILDGIVGTKGDSSRGSRYNSAITYLEYRGNAKPTFIIVVSEDGFVDILPSLRPRVKHSNILHNLDLLRQLSTQENPEVALYNKLMSYFNSTRFYLAKEECIRVNELQKVIEGKQKDDAIRIIYEDYSPHPEMNNSYYEDEVQL